MTDSTIVAYYSLFLIIIGTLSNSLTLLILCQSSFKDTKKHPIIHYMRAIAIFDILMLYGWNLQHYLVGVYGFTLETYSIPSCKFFLFFGYFTVHTTAWIRVFVCLDRYLSLSRLHKTWFSHSKNVLIIIIATICLIALINLHLMIFGCYYTFHGIIDTNSPLYQIFPMWDYVTIVIYNFIPFVLMVILNGGAIYHLIRIQHQTTVRNSRIHHRSISITLFITTFLFLIMTLPASVAFGFFQTTLHSNALVTVDGILFTYHITSFPLYMITFKEFRHEFIRMITCRTNNPRVRPINNVPTPKIWMLPGIKLNKTVQLIRHNDT